VADRIAYSIDEAAAACGVSTTLIRQALRDGKLAGRAISQKRVVITEEDLVRWIEESPTYRER
jgi:excisionase family DNA binding protein